jgi:ABC-2 type transport system permease protein
VTTATRSPSIGRLIVHQFHYEQKSYWRNPVSAFFSFLFPIIFLVIFASINGGDHVDFLGDIKFNQYFVPAIAAFGVISASYSYLGVQLSLRRDAGIFKRLRGTPLPATSLIAGIVSNALVIAVLLFALTLAVGTVFYGLVWHGHLLALTCSLLLGAACFCSLGVAVSTLTPNGDAAPAVVNLLLFPLTFISGTFFPVRASRTISHIAAVFPIKPFTDAVFAPFNPTTQGLGFSGHDMYVLGLWTVGSIVVAIRRWRWEPRHQ